ncbi:F0F1 ATP synthase subunit epsilon [Brachybacterium squillarum]|uniref:F0F1 ATP synthase subunit epsilon n=1 Tax=Brachybacterium squillarum TaxID=661979 RepID=UPI00026296B4|nr:F0F1 ATP synthase subunit epsilon [Brachybacterium squillarum]
MSALDVTFVTSDRTEWSGKAARVVVPAADGSMGILPRMQPTLAVLDRGIVRITSDSGEVTEREVRGGFVSVDADVVTIAVDHADRPASR